VLSMRAFILILALGTVLAGCAAMLVPLTSDPDKKLGYAYTLFDQLQRPLPAEHLIREAIAIYQEKNDELKLAEAYRIYGGFFRSGSIDTWHKHYEKRGFEESGATYAKRYDKSIEYFEKAATIFEKNKKYDDLTNVYLNMGLTYEYANQPEKACEQYSKSAISNQQYMRNNPGASVNLPKGFNSYEAYVVSIKERLKCS